MFWNSEKDEKSNEETSKLLVEVSEALNNPFEANWYFLFFFVLFIIVWLTVLLIPNLIIRFFEIFEIGKISIIVLSIPLWLGFFLAYTFLRIKISDSEENSMLDSDMMSSINYQTSANKRYFIWIGSILFAIFNTILLGIVSYFLTYNGLYLFDV